MAKFRVRLVLCSHSHLRTDALYTFPKTFLVFPDTARNTALDCTGPVPSRRALTCINYYVTAFMTRACSHVTHDVSHVI